MVNDLAYWNLRAVEAKIDVEKNESPLNCEQLALARCMVKLIESQVFNSKG